MATVVWNEFIAQTANNGINFSFTDLEKRIKDTIDEALSQPPVSGEVCDNCGNGKPSICDKCYEIESNFRESY